MPPNKIAVVGPGIVGMPLAAMLAGTRSIDGWPPPRVVVVQRNSPTSGWKVEAINEGRSPLGAVEPELATAVSEAVHGGRLTATHDYGTCSDADAIFVCVTTDRAGLAPDHAPLLEALEGIAVALKKRPAGSRPLVIIESTLAPSTMQSVVAPLFAHHGLRDGEDVLLGNSPSRVRPGNVMDHITRTDRIVAGLHPEAPVQMAPLYRRILTTGRVHVTNSLTASLATTLENAFRDVRAAFSSEIARYCDRIDVDYFTVRDLVNAALGVPDDASWDGSAPATGALLLPTVGVGGHCLPKDGVLLWWRALEEGHPSRNSLVLAARAVNDASPAALVRVARLRLGAFTGRGIAVLGAAAHADSDDTRNAPALVLASLLRDTGADVLLHDPHVRPDDARVREEELALTNDLDDALRDRPVVFLATAHRAYRGLAARLRESARVRGVIDGAHAFHPGAFEGSDVDYTAIGRGRLAPDRRLVQSVLAMYRAVSRGVANEAASLVRFLNDRHADDRFNRASVEEVLSLVATAPNAIALEAPGEIEEIVPYEGFVSGLAQLAADASPARQRAPRVVPALVPPGIWFGNEDAVVTETDTPWPLTPLQ